MPLASVAAITLALALAAVATPQPVSPALPLAFDLLGDTCPPCFDCHLPIYKCLNFGTCSDFSGECECPVGFGGDDCGQPQCDSPASGPKRHIRLPSETQCACTDGWDGINCNVCTRNAACSPLVPPVGPSDNATCYSSVIPVHRNYMQCDVT
ncbi:hypothetical protein BDK51DRAFT_29835, partial [Blyttiomyces helicus]